MEHFGVNMSSTLLLFRVELKENSCMIFPFRAGERSRRRPRVPLHFPLEILAETARTVASRMNIAPKFDKTCVSFRQPSDRHRLAGVREGNSARPTGWSGPGNPAGAPKTGRRLGEYSSPEYFPVFSLSCSVSPLLFVASTLVQYSAFLFEFTSASASGSILVPKGPGARVRMRRKTARATKEL